MPILNRLTALYETRGIEISTGLNPCHFGNLPQVNFTWFIKDGVSLTNGYGIALQEIYFLECLFQRFQPRSLFVIGNSAGWSTFALALLNPTGRVLAMDAGFDRNALDGLSFTNRVAEEEGLAIRAVKGVSPQDVGTVLAANTAAPVDFAFIDGYHTAEQVVLDFEAIRPHASAEAVYLFHDVHEFKLQPGIEIIARQSGLDWDLLLGTPSGMAIVYDRARHPTIRDDIAPFRAHAAALALMKDEVARSRHRHLSRWKRSLRKRLPWLMPATRT